MTTVVIVKDESIRKRCRDDIGSSYDNDNDNDNSNMRNKKSINDYLKDLSISSSTQNLRDSNNNNNNNNNSEYDHLLMNDVVDDL